MKSRRLIDKTVHGLLESFDLRAEHPGDPNNNHYISFSNWQWRPLLDLCKKVSALEVLDIDFSAWDSNDGHLVDEETCIHLAKAIRKYVDKFLVHGRIYVTQKMDPKWASLYGIDKEDIEEFVEFLETCEGFSIW